ncbi:hypothetical protein BDN71DRAFT_1454446 [Pleurotus eryngii]|uniref:Plasma membrane proteolipid 3 n=1 Tax=Pleurotus eryngii TaxID=5323 RepID=A0A9P6DCD6_PLEER|nr:hypothetical protein BDN71DRAFT_1454446 [Pleurotus eryngii]
MAKLIAVSVDFWINLLLCLLGWIPGVIHAWYVCPRLFSSDPPRTLFPVGTSSRNTNGLREASPTMDSV